jgi:hypothetical protein
MSCSTTEQPVLSSVIEKIICIASRKTSLHIYEIEIICIHFLKLISLQNCNFTKLLSVYALINSNRNL